MLELQRQLSGLYIFERLSSSPRRDGTDEVDDPAQALLVEGGFLYDEFGDWRRSHVFSNSAKIT